MPPAPSDPADKCPVDHKTREKWLEAAKAKRSESQPAPPLSPPAPPVTPRDLRKAQYEFEATGDKAAFSKIEAQIQQLTQGQKRDLLAAYQEQSDLEIKHALGRTKFDLDGGSWAPIAQNSDTTTRQKRKQLQEQSVNATLLTDREVSSIPRALPTNHERQHLNSAEAAALPPPANNEKDTGRDRETGNWIYPSQEMFFAAMKRKGHDPEQHDMQTIVPIHNAVNERAWNHILEWERGRGSEACGGPKLVSFAGDSKALTPKARWNNLVLGYAKPFDRHDWVVDRCGKKVGYVIDFYSGRGGEGPLSFYLDVRPKINSWEGVSTRIGKAVGM